MINNLADALVSEKERCRELLVAYKEIGSVGAFGVIMLEALLKRADEVILSGDIIAMLSIYEELKCSN